MTESKPRIGIIGLGIMGLAMAKNAVKAGFPVVGYNRSPQRAEEAKAAGIKIAESPKALAAESDIIVTMVTDPKAVQAVLMGNHGVFEGSVAGKTLIQMSTVDVKTTMHCFRDAQERYMKFLDCPVTGSKVQVENAQLILLAGGDAGVIDECQGFLLSIGKAIVHAGDVGKGTSLKLAMNLIVAQMTSALCESTALAKVLGVAPEKVFEVISHSPALNCGYFQIKRQALLNEDFSPAFSLANMLKDVRFMDEAAKEHRLALPITNAVKFVMEAAVHEGFAEEDLSSIAKVLRPKVVRDGNRI